MVNPVLIRQYSDNEGLLVNLHRCGPKVVQLIAAQHFRGRQVLRTILWNGERASNADAKRLMRDAPEFYGAIASEIDGRSPVEIVTEARELALPRLEALRLLPPPPRQYGEAITSPSFALEVETQMTAGPWLNMRVRGPGKRGPRLYYLSWNGETIRGGHHLKALAEHHPNYLERLTAALVNTTPWELSALSRITEFEELRYA